MQKFTGDLPDSYEYGIVWWGQSNARPWGDRDLEGYVKSPHLKLAPAGDDITINRIEGFPVGAAHGYDNSTSTVYVAESIVPNHYVGGELRLLQAEAQDPFYSTQLPAVGAIIGNGTSVLGNYFVVRWTKGITRKCTAATSGNLLTLASHGLVNGDKVKFVEAVSGITVNTECTVQNATTDTFQLNGVTIGANGDCWFRTSSVNPTIWKYSGYVHSLDKWKGYGNVRVLTPYQPEVPGAYPAGAPKVPGYSFPATVTGYDSAGVFLPFAWDEGQDGLGFTGTNLTVSASGVTLTLNAPAVFGAPDIYAGARVTLTNGAGEAFVGTVASNTSGTVATTTGVWTPSTPPDAGSYTFEIAVPHWRSNPHAAVPGKGFRYPSNDMMPGGTSTSGRIYNRSAFQSNFSYKTPVLEPGTINTAFRNTGVAQTSGPFRTQWVLDGATWKLTVLRNTMTQTPAAGFQFEVFLRDNYIVRLLSFQAITNEFNPSGFWRVSSYTPSAVPASGSIITLNPVVFGGNTSPAFSISSGATKSVANYDGGADTVEIGTLTGDVLPGMSVEFDTSFDGIVAYRVYTVALLVAPNKITLNYNGNPVNITTTGTAPVGTNMRVLNNLTVRKVTSTTVTTNRITVDDTVDLQTGDAIVFSGNIGNLVAGRTYYIDKIHGSTEIEVRDIYGNVIALATDSGTLTATITTLRMHKTDHGSATVTRMRNVLHHRFGAMIEFAWRVANATGKRINVIALGINSSAQIFRNSPNYFSYPGQIGWWDYNKYLDWTPSDPDGNAVRLEKMLEVIAPAALQAEGNTKPLKILGIVGFQGEGDAIVEVGREMYSKTLNTFYQWLRNAIHDAGLSPYSTPTRIPVVHASLPTQPWELAGTFYGATLVGDTEGLVNAAISDFAAKDGFAATIDTNSSPKLDNLVFGNDPLHFNGVGEAMNGELAADAFIDVANCAIPNTDKSKVLEICNLALSHLGESANITSIDPPDGSVQAAHCARFYPIARDSLLEMRSWSFASKRKALTSVTNTLTEWDYAYVLPCDLNTVIAVLPPSASDDYSTTYAPQNAQFYTAPMVAAGQYVPQPYTVEVDEYGYKLLYTDQKDAMLRYNALITDTTKFTPLFTMALSWHLASMLAGPILKGDVGAAEAKRCQTMMAAYLGKAEAQDSQQRNIKPEQITPWMSGR